MYKKIILIFSICILSIMCSACSKEEEDFYEIEYVELTSKEKEELQNDIYSELFEVFEDEKVTTLENDYLDFYISKKITAKELFGFDVKKSTNLNSFIIEDINITRYLYEVDMNNYYFYKAGDRKDNIISFKNLINNKPTVVIYLDAFCESCDRAIITNVNELDLEKYNYFYIVPNSNIEEQIEFIKSKGGDVNKIYVTLGLANGSDNLIDELATPCTLFTSSDGLIRIVRQYSIANEVLKTSHLEMIQDEYFPIINKEEGK